jgi:hypothetical protein
MKAIRVIVHSLVLVLADLGGIALGAVAAFKILGTPNQIWLQLPIAAVLTLVLVCFWLLTLRLFRWRAMRLGSGKEKIVCFAVSLLWGPLVFVPLHYFTQGYLTSFGNLVAFAIYQLPMNVFALGVASLLRSPGSAEPRVQ